MCCTIAACLLHALIRKASSQLELQWMNPRRLIEHYGMEHKWPRQHKGVCSCADDAVTGPGGGGELLARGWLGVNEGERVNLAR